MMGVKSTESSSKKYNLKFMEILALICGSFLLTLASRKKTFVELATHFVVTFLVALVLYPFVDKVVEYVFDFYLK